MKLNPCPRDSRGFHCLFHTTPILTQPTTTEQIKMYKKTEAISMNHESISMDPIEPRSNLRKQKQYL